MQKKIALLILAFLVLFQHSFSFTFAQTSLPSSAIPEICGSASPGMIQYQNFQQDMSSLLLGGILGERVFERDLSVLGFFTSEILQLPAAENSLFDTIVSSLRNNSRRLGTATLTTSVLL
jgi:hypothetical protein